jgi:hypothetical protein
MAKHRETPYFATHACELASNAPELNRASTGGPVPVDHHPATLAVQSPVALVTTATSQPALRTGFAALGLVSLLDLSTADSERGADRMLAFGGAAAAGWFLVRGFRRR